MRAWFVLIAAAALHAQSAQFEVAAVRRAPPPEGDTYQINLGTIQHGTLTLTNTTVADSLRFAYHIPSDKQIDGPPWINDKEFHYVLVAKTSPDAERETLFPMLQSLLAERFRMKTHWETRELNHYELTRSKSGIVGKSHQRTPASRASSHFGWIASTAPRSRWRPCAW